MAKTLRTSGDYTIQAGDGYNAGSGANTITLNSLNVSVSGNLTVGGTSTTVSTTNTTIEDNIIELNSGLSQSLNDSGIIIERGSTGDNAAIVWDESEDTFKLGTTTATGADKSGGITVTAGALEVAAFTATTGTFSGAVTSVGFTVGGNLTAGSITTNAISSNGSNADISIQPSGTGDVLLSALRVNGTTLDSSDSSKITLAEAVDITGAVTITSGTITGITDLAVADGGTGASSLTDNAVLTGTGTSAITAESNLSFSGSTLAVTGNITATGTSTIDNLTFNDNIIGSSSNADINLTPGGTGNVVLSSSLDFGSAVLSNGTATHAGSSGQQPLDEFAHATYRSAKYVVSITDATNTKYEIVELYITHDGSNAYISSQGVNSSTGGLAEFAADISGANLRVLIIPSTAESVTYKYLRTLIIV